MYLTRPQHEIVEFVRDFRDRTGISPTLEEIAKHRGVTKITVYEHVNQLERKGAIKREKHRARSIEVLVPPRERRHFPVPITGLLRNGLPIEAPEEPSGFDPREILPFGPAYQALRVMGDSLAGEHLADGDLVLIERREPLEGEAIVAVCDDRAATLGRLFREDRRIRLQPATSGDWKRYPKTLEVRGVVVGVLRRFPCPA